MPILDSGHGPAPLGSGRRRVGRHSGGGGGGGGRRLAAGHGVVGGASVDLAAREDGGGKGEREFSRQFR